MGKYQEKKVVANSDFFNDLFDRLDLYILFNPCIF